MPLSTQPLIRANRQWPYATLPVLLFFMMIGRSFFPHEASYDEGMRKGAIILTLLTCAWVIGKDRRRLLIAVCLALAPILAQFLSKDWSRLQLLLNERSFFTPPFSSSRTSSQSRISTPTRCSARSAPTCCWP